jgi:hypothetical protein
MIKTYEYFLADCDKDFEHEDIVVAKYDTLSGLKKDHKYRVAYPQPYTDKDFFYVYDLHNNTQIYCHPDHVISEMEYELGGDLKKYNM